MKNDDHLIPKLCCLARKASLGQHKGPLLKIHMLLCSRLDHTIRTLCLSFCCPGLCLSLPESRHMSTTVSIYYIILLRGFFICLAH